MRYRFFALFLLLTHTLFSEVIETFYGPLSVEEPVLLELIHSTAVQRLKNIHQYGVAYYTTHKEEYNRFDHSLGVFAILRRNGASLEEQISGVLHDTSHTVFSHVGDWLFSKEYQELDYQMTIHKIHLAVSGIEEILNRHGYTVDQVLPKGPNFIMLEQSLPNASADRIDYNIQGAYFQHFLTKEEAIELFEDFRFVNGQWIATRKDLLLKMARFSLFMTLECWGNDLNYALSRWLADAMLQGLKIGLISWRELHFGIDQDVWQKLESSDNLKIRERMIRIKFPKNFFERTDPSRANHFIKFRCRGVDPWVLHEGKVSRLSSVDNDFMAEFQSLKKQSERGWPVYLLP